MAFAQEMPLSISQRLVARLEKMLLSWRECKVVLKQLLTYLLLLLKSLSCEECDLRRVPLLSSSTRAIMSYEPNSTLSNILCENTERTKLLNGPEKFETRSAFRMDSTGEVGNMIIRKASSSDGKLAALSQAQAEIAMQPAPSTKTKNMISSFPDKSSIKSDRSFASSHNVSSTMTDIANSKFRIAWAGYDKLPESSSATSAHADCMPSKSENFLSPNNLEFYELSQRLKLLEEEQEGPP